MVRPVNCALYRYQAAEASMVRNGRYWRGDWHDIETGVLPFMERLSVEQRRLRDAFRSYDWPEEVRQFEQDFETELQGDIEWYSRVAGANSWVEFQSAYERDRPDPRVGADIREVLDLPKVTDDEDPCVTTDGGTVRRIS